MGTCSFVSAEGKACKRKDFKDGLCTDHIPKAPKVDAPTYTLTLGRTKGAAAVNPAFAARADSDTPAQPYKRRIEALRSAGPVSGGEETVHGVSCLHDTQKANNVTVWYSWQGNAMTVWGLGSHAGGSGAGNKKYSMLWCDGTNKSWTRG